MADVNYLTFILALIFTIGLIVLLGAGVRYWQEKYGAGFTKSGQTHRLQVLTSTMLDTRRRLILIRRDRQEHLLLIGGPNDLLIESNISPPQAS